MVVTELEHLQWTDEPHFKVRYTTAVLTLFKRVGYSHSERKG
jgi:hypothetical protein